MTHLPNFFVVGATKAGTTALYRYLERHPQVYVCPIKEPNFFSKDIDIEAFNPHYARLHASLDIKEYLAQPRLEQRHLEFIREWSDYCQLFREMGSEKVAGEVSSAYLYSRVAAGEIVKRIPSARIIMILRDPVERAFSHYKMDLGSGSVSGSFVEEFKKDNGAAVKGWGITHLYRELGLYHEQVKRYLDAIPCEQVRIYLYDDWVQDNQAVLGSLAAFLGIEPFEKEGPIVSNKVESVPRRAAVTNWLQRIGVGTLSKKLLPDTIRQRVRDLFYEPVSVRLTDADRRQIHPFFSEDIAQLERLLGRDLSAWKMAGR